MSTSSHNSTNHHIINQIMTAALTNILAPDLGCSAFPARSSSKGEIDFTRSEAKGRFSTRGKSIRFSRDVEEYIIPSRRNTQQIPLAVELEPFRRAKQAMKISARIERQKMNWLEERSMSSSARSISPPRTPSRMKALRCERRKSRKIRSPPPPSSGQRKSFAPLE